jgi:integrase
MAITPRKNAKGEIVSYYIRVYKGYDKAGRRLKPYTMTWKPEAGMTKKQIEREVNKVAMQFEEQCESGLITSSPKLLLNDFIPQYFDIVEDSLSPVTFQFYKNCVATHISPLLGDLRLKEIKPVHVQDFVKKLSTHKVKAGMEKRSPATVRRYLTVLQSIMKQAVKLELIAVNPANMEKLTVQKMVAPKIEIFTKQEAAEMLACLENEDLQFQVLIQLGIMTGARRGELVALKFSDFDYTANKLTIERTAVKVTGKPTQLKPPKDYEIRTIAVNQLCMDLVQMLRREKDFEAERLGETWVEGDWLFTQWNGEIMNPHSPTKMFRKFLEQNGIRHRKFHSIRHTSATLLLYGGVSIKQVSERLGHGDIETTNKYLHYLSEADEEAARVLGDMLMGGEK